MCVCVQGEVTANREDDLLKQKKSKIQIQSNPKKIERTKLVQQRNGMKVEEMFGTWKMMHKKLFRKQISFQVIAVPMQFKISEKQNQIFFFKIDSVALKISLHKATNISAFSRTHLNVTFFGAYKVF